MTSVPGSSTFHQSTPCTQKQLSEYETITQRQDQQILEYLQQHPTEDFTAEDLAVKIPAPMLTTSIRRALSDLTKAGKINRVGFRKGVLGRNIGKYQAVK
jgi:Fe2+ or Zn2+ uptake regulation protein